MMQNVVFSAVRFRLAPRVPSRSCAVELVTGKLPEVPMVVCGMELEGANLLLANFSPRARGIVRVNPLIGAGGALRPEHTPNTDVAGLTGRSSKRPSPRFATVFEKRRLRTPPAVSTMRSEGCAAPSSLARRAAPGDEAADAVRVCSRSPGPTRSMAIRP